MITKEDLGEAKGLISKVRVCLANIDRHATQSESRKLNQIFSKIEKAEMQLEKLIENVK